MFETKINQLNKLVVFAEALELYLTRLDLRMQEYLDTPDRHGVLARFIACAVMHEDIRDKFSDYQKSLRWNLPHNNSTTDN